MCTLDRAERVKIFGEEFVDFASELVNNWPLLHTYKEYNVFGYKMDVIEVLRDFPTFCERADTNVEYISAVVDYGMKAISDDLIKPIEAMGSISGLSTGTIKDTQVKYLKAAEVLIEQAVKAFCKVGADAQSWLHHELGSILVKHSIELRIENAKGLTWQARLRAEDLADQVAPAAPQRPARKSALSVLPSPEKHGASNDKRSKTKAKVHMHRQ